WVEVDVVAWPRRADGQAIGKRRPSHPTRVAYAHLVFAVSRHVEHEPGIFAVAGAAVVVTVIERYDGKPIGRKNCARRMDVCLVHRRAQRMVRRRRVELSDSLALVVPELAIVIRAFWQLKDAA